MIRTDKEYKEALKRLKEEKKAINAQKKKLQENKMKASEIKNLMEPIESFHMQLVEEVEWYEKTRKGVIEPVYNLPQIGRRLIALRIARGLSQADLAKRLKVERSQVSRDERNEYHGITIDRAQKIFDVLEYKFKGEIEDRPHRHDGMMAVG